jgi:hypothetical protein
MPMMSTYLLVLFQITLTMTEVNSCFTEMAGYYVIFNGKAAGIYSSWRECAKHVLGVSNAIYQKYKTYDEAVREFEARVRDVNPNLGAPEGIPHDVVPLLGPPDLVAPPIGEAKLGCSKVLLIIICLAILALGLWLFIHLCL